MSSTDCEAYLCLLDVPPRFDVYYDGYNGSRSRLVDDAVVLRGEACLCVQSGV